MSDDLDDASDFPDVKVVSVVKDYDDDELRVDYDDDSVSDDEALGMLVRGTARLLYDMLFADEEDE